MRDEILIPTGEFLYGEDNKPRRLNAYYIDKYPVTNVEYQKFVEATGHRVPEHWRDGRIPRGLENHPVVYVSWCDAVVYARWIGKRLPKEAEWEKAARGTDGRLWPWGNEWDKSKCNNVDLGLGATTPVDRYSPRGDSPYGVADLAGNVWEWCADWWGYGINAGKVIRGGSFLYNGYNATTRSNYGRTLTSFDVGFRCVRRRV